MQKLNQTIAKQKGAVLILMAFIIGLGVLAYLLHAFDPAKLRLEQDKKTLQTLNEAKQALIAWAVTHPNTPGMMPWPDRNTDLDFAPYPNAYDGRSDCVTTAFSRPYLLGQLPWRGQSNPCTLPHTGLGTEFTDAQGNHLWYAVSRNLVHDYENGESPIINPGMINAPHAITPYLRQGGTESYPWLQVLDRNGNVVSDKVAAVIIAPGNAIGGQDRSAAAPNPSEFLDSFRIGATTYNNSNYSVINEDFVIGEDSRNVSASDPTFVRPYNFNDKLVYITIDELMAAVEKRVGEQVRTSLKAYQDVNGYYPYSTQLGTTANLSCWQNAAGTDGLKEGLLPANYQSCTYTRVTTPTNSSTISCVNTIFNPAASLGVTQVRFTRTGGNNFTTTTGGGTCVRSNTTCTCTGAGSCSNATNSPRVTCTTSGCTAIGTGSLGTFRTTGDKFTFRSGGCAQTIFPNPNAVTGCASNNAQITCSGVNGSAASCGDVRFDNLLPAWFNQNQWGNFVYYRMTVPRLTPALPQMAIGNRNTEAVVVIVGRPIDTTPFALSKTPVAAAQVRPSCNILNNYLDSVENINGDTLYDATSTLRSANYNDQTFVVAP